MAAGLKAYHGGGDLDPHGENDMRSGTGLLKLHARRSLLSRLVVGALLLPASGCISSDVLARAFAEDLAATVATVVQFQLLEAAGP